MRHKSYFLLSMLLSMFYAFSLFAQPRYGLKAGFSLPDVHYSGIEDPFIYTGALQKKSSPIFQVFGGGVMELDWKKNLTFSAELLLAGKGYHLTAPIGTSDYQTFSTRLWYIQVPVALNIRWRGFFAGAGPYAGFGIAGKTYTTMFDPNKNTTVKFTNKANFGNTSDKQIRTFDYGVQAQAGYSFRNFRLLASYALGLADWVPAPYSENASALHRVISVGASYYLGVGE